MIIEIPAYKHILDEQRIDLTNKRLCTLIGGNGSGKSTLLEAVFNKYIVDENDLRSTYIDEENEVSYLDGNNINDNIKCIAFSSGQNELFSKIFDNNEKNSSTFGRRETYQANSFYFNYDWSRLLVFLASSLKPNGLVSTYLSDKNYITLEDNIDVSSRLSFSLRVRKPLIDSIYREQKIEEGGEYVDKPLYRSLYVKYLEKLINITYDENYDFTDDENYYRIVSSLISLNANEVITSLGNNINEIFTFFARASTSWLSNFSLEDISLYFNNDLEFEQLSDGEYQLLAIYALIDLFDNENTIFLLDEVDSHLHYKNINKLWTALKNINGKVITTTHSYESIIINEFEDINYIENGNITYYEKDIELFKKLSSITNHNNYGFKISSQKENVVLIDDIVDWIIFKKLVFKKIGRESNKVLNKITPYKKTSNYDNSSQIFGHGKLSFVKDISQLDFDIKTKNFFLICDRDKLEEDLIRSNLEVNIHRDFDSIKRFNNRNTKTFLLSWKRLEIENYLISKTMLENYELFDDFKTNFEYLNFDSIDNFDDISDIKKFDCKSITHPIYKEGGFNEANLDEIIAKIPPSEISEDIVKMYDFIKSKI